ncbi:MAG: hypothetical protein ACQXXG_09405 [Candidatus Bathyarchaeia archaeon]|nr:hypothetical protein [Candidatus Bathyarchaeota archaeon A05DMB-3]
MSGDWWLREREGFSWKMLLAALVLVVAGVLLMLQSTNMLFEMNPMAVFVMGLAAVLIFAGVILIVLAIAALASI